MSSQHKRSTSARVVFGWRRQTGALGRDDVDRDVDRGARSAAEHSRRGRQVAAVWLVNRKLRTFNVSQHQQSLRFRVEISDRRANDSASDAVLACISSCRSHPLVPFLTKIVFV